MRGVDGFLICVCVREERQEENKRERDGQRGPSQLGSWQNTQGESFNTYSGERQQISPEGEKAA